MEIYFAFAPFVLVEEFGVARVTVRQAVELLARDGLVSPQQGHGTFVTARKLRKD